MLVWRSMKDWRESGPVNGTELLLLLPTLERIIASFDGTAQVWRGHSGYALHVTPVAWAEIPAVPRDLMERQRVIAAERERLDALEKSSLF